MTITVKHHYVSANGDPADPTVIGQSKWNANHDVASTDPDGSIVFALSGVLTASANITWDETGRILTLNNQAGTASIFGASGVVATPNGVGISLVGGNAFAGSNADGGSSVFQGGNSDGSGIGGDGAVIGGATSTGYAGNGSVSGGNATSTGAGGAASVTGGNSAGGAGGDCTIGPGQGVTNGNLFAQNIPSIDPQSQNAVFNDSGVLSFSQQPGAWLASALQRYLVWYPTSGTTQPSMIGSAPASVTGTWSNVGGTNTNATTRQLRASCITAASAGATAVFAPSGGRIFTGAAVKGSYSELLCGIGVNTTGHQCFFGLAASVSALSGDPSALTNAIGVGFDAADSSAGNWQFYVNDGSGTATKTDTGIPRNINQALFIKAYNRPNSVTWDFFAQDLNSGVSYTNSGISSNTPADGQAMAPVHLIRTGALTSAISMFLIGGFSKWMTS